MLRKDKGHYTIIWIKSMVAGDQLYIQQLGREWKLD